MAPTFDGRSFRVRSSHLYALTALGLALFALAGPVRADGQQPLAFGHPLAHGQPVLMDVTDDIKADVRVTTWNQPSVDITVTPSGHYAETVRVSGGVENGTLAMHVVCSPSPHKGFFGWLVFFRPEAQIDMRVPATATLSVHVINGPITVDGVTGELQVTLVNGPITVTGAGTQLYLTTTNGPIEATIAKITAQPNITISTTNGPVELYVPKGFKAKVHASTVFGPVENDLTDANGPGTVSLETVNGPVTISPP
jgi:putative adhesin